jgi:serine/threonine-protein kinase PknG
MSNDPNLCPCGTAYDEDGVCPDCGNTKPTEKVAGAPSDTIKNSSSNRSLSARSKSSRARNAARSIKTKVTARPSTVLNVAAKLIAGTGKNLRRRSDVSTRSTTHSVGRIAAGLIDIEPLPAVEPLQLINWELSTPKDARYCYNPECKWLHDHPGEPRNLYRERGDGTAIDKGICPSCRTPFNFAPIPSDTVIAGQFIVQGPVAQGGFGFIYLAWDQFVGRYVILKDLLNSTDPEMQALAVQERRFLADLQDPHIVSIYTFVTYDDPETKASRALIVMEFIDGKTLKQIKKQWMREHNNEPLPVTEAIYYILGILPAFTYMHKKKVLYCDFKMDNAMYQGERLRLIDLGACRKFEDESDSFRTPGYSAPEASVEEPTLSSASDLYTIGRTLAILSMNFDWSEEHEFDLPTPDEEPLFAKYESFYRFLLKACNNDPDLRFESADAMAEQLLLVLAEIVSIDSEQQRLNINSTEFATDILKEEGVPTFRSIPDIKVDSKDSAAALIEAAIAENSPQEQVRLMRQAVATFPKSAEASIRLASVLTDLEQYGEASTILAQRIEADPYDFRSVWMQGRLYLAQQQYEEAYVNFDAVYSEVPGELAPKLALAIASELKGDLDTAIRYYELTSSNDRSYVTAIFGLARTLKARDAGAAIDAYERVSPLSIAYTPALTAKVRAILANDPDEEGFNLASETLARINSRNLEMHRLRAELLLKALEQLASKRLVASEKTLLGVKLTDLALRSQAEIELRECGRYAQSSEDKFAYIDQANAVRCFTTF